MSKKETFYHYQIEDAELNLSQSEENKFGKEGYKKLRSNAKAREIPFEIKSVEELVRFWTSQPDSCFWCGHTLVEYQKLCNDIIKYRGKSNLIHKLKKIIQSNNNKFLTFDRRDSNLGYRIDNLVKACLICNISKGFIISEPQYSLIAKDVIDSIMKEV